MNTVEQFALRGLESFLVEKFGPEAERSAESSFVAQAAREKILLSLTVSAASSPTPVPALEGRPAERGEGATPPLPQIPPPAAPDPEIQTPTEPPYMDALRDFMEENTILYTRKEIGFDAIVQGVIDITDLPEAMARTIANKLYKEALAEYDAETFRMSLATARPKVAPPLKISAAEDSEDDERHVAPARPQAQAVPKAGPVYQPKHEITPEMLAMDRDSAEYKALPRGVKISIRLKQHANVKACG